MLLTPQVFGHAPILDSFCCTVSPACDITIRSSDEVTRTGAHPTAGSQMQQSPQHRFQRGRRQYWSRHELEPAKVRSAPLVRSGPGFAENLAETSFGGFGRFESQRISLAYSATTKTHPEGLPEALPRSGTRALDLGQWGGADWRLQNLEIAEELLANAQVWMFQCSRSVL